MKKLTKAFYPGIIALIILNSFNMLTDYGSKYDSIFPIVIIVVLCLLGFSVYLHDKYKKDMVVDERSTILAYKSGYYSWWFSIFLITFLSFADILIELKHEQLFSIILISMLSSIVILHMYFNLTNKID